MRNTNSDSQRTPLKHDSETFSSCQASLRFIQLCHATLRMQFNVI